MKCKRLKSFIRMKTIIDKTKDRLHQTDIAGIIGIKFSAIIIINAIVRGVQATPAAIRRLLNRTGGFFLFKNTLPQAQDITSIRKTHINYRLQYGVSPIYPYDNLSTYV